MVEDFPGRSCSFFSYSNHINTSFFTLAQITKREKEYYDAGSKNRCSVANLAGYFIQLFNTIF